MRGSGWPPPFNQLFALNGNGSLGSIDRKSYDTGSIRVEESPCGKLFEGLGTFPLSLSLAAFSTTALSC